MQLPPRERFTAGLLVALCVVSTLFATVLGMLNSGKNSLIQSQQQQIKELTVLNNKCTEASIAREREYAERENRRAEIRDSIARVNEDASRILKSYKNGKK